MLENIAETETTTQIRRLIPLCHYYQFDRYNSPVFCLVREFFLDFDTVALSLLFGKA